MSRSSRPSLSLILLRKPTLVFPSPQPCPCPSPSPTVPCSLPGTHLLSHLPPGPSWCSLLPLIQCSVYLTLALPWDGLFCCLELSGSSCMCDCLAYHVVLLSWDRLECELHNGKSCLCFILFLKCFWDASTVTDTGEVPRRYLYWRLGHLFLQGLYYYFGRRADLLHISSRVLVWLL